MRTKRGPVLAWVVMVTAGASACSIPVPGGAQQSGNSGDPSLAAVGSDVTVSDLEAVESAVVRVVAEGTFVDPEQGELLNLAGTGSGFIIDSSGIAVTNNHVVTGGAFFEVYVGGDDQPRNARVLGVSECSDVAVIDIDGDGFPSLSWADAEPAVGSEVYAAGFPLGESEFTLTKGIVSRAATTGETSWASVDQVLLHDATINPGNSGGPLVDAQGRVIGVNYAGDGATGQFFAISGDEAQPLLEQLQGGTDVTSIGVNGEAFVLEDGTSGIWVSSVESGSPADTAGIQGGDIITRLENILISTDGTMSQYCDVLRSNSPGDILAIEVVRVSTGEVLAGQINGDVLTVTQTFANDLGGSVSAPGQAYTDYYEVSDNTGAITVSIPSEWIVLDGGGIQVDDTTRWPALGVGRDASALDGWGTPGAIITAGDLGGVPVETVLDTLGPGLSEGACTLVGRSPYDDGLYVGAFDLYESCGGTSTIFVSVAVEPPDRSYIVYIAVQATTDADLAALDRFLETFVITGV